MTLNLKASLHERRQTVKIKLYSTKG